MGGQIKSYFCPSHPNGLFGDIKFAGGWYRTDRLSEQRFLEKHRWFGWRIKLIPETVTEVIEDAPEPDVIGKPVLDPTLLTVQPNESPPPAPKEEPEPVTEEFQVPKFTKTEIGKMKRAQLEDLCCALDLEWEDKTVNQMRLSVKRELGLK